MAFGGWFGGSSSSSSSNTNNSPTTTTPSTDFSPPSAPLTSSSESVSPLSSSLSSSTSPEDIKSRLQTAISTQSNLLNARYLIQKINDNCFDHCVTQPGEKLSQAEEKCLSVCMEKYIDGWNTVSRVYVGRLQREGVGMMQSGQGAGKEMF